MTHCKSANVALRSLPMVGSATLTMVTSRSAMKRPKLTAASAHHLRGFSAKSPAPARPPWVPGVVAPVVDAMLVSFMLPINQLMGKDEYNALHSLCQSID